MGTNNGGREFDSAWTERPETAYRFLSELHMTSPDEDVRKKSAEAKEPEKPSASPGDPISFVGQLLGDAKNLAVDAASGTHSGDKFLSAITPELAAQYQRGKEVQERLASRAVKDKTQLSANDRKNLEAFENVRKNIGQVPLYDRDSLTRYVEKGIAQKAKTAPPDGQSRVSKEPVARPAAASNPEQIVRQRGVAQKAVSHPLQADKPIHPVQPNRAEQLAKSAQPVRKDVVAQAGDTRTAIAKPIQPAHLPERIAPESKTAGGRTPQDQNTSSSSRDVKADPVRNLSSVPGSGQVTLSEQRAAAADGAKAGRTETHLQTSHNQKENRGDRVWPVSPGAHSQSSELQPVSETVIKPTNRPTQDVKPQGSEISKTESLVSKTSIAGSSAIGTFERRTGYDARDRQAEKQNLPGKSIEANNQAQASAAGSGEVQEAKPKGVESQLRYVAHHDVAGAQSEVERAGATQYRRCFEKMRRVLDERTYIANNPVQRNAFAEQPQVQPSVKLQENAITREIPRHLPGSDSRISLAEIKSGLPDQQVQQIARISEERFPAGLRWQNTICQPDAAPPAGRARPPETPGVIPSVKPPDRSAGNTSIRPQTPGEIRQDTVGQNQSGAAKVLSFNGRVNDRYITGAEIALAAIIAAAGAKRIRFDETKPGCEIATPIPRVQKIQAFLPNTAACEKGTARTDAPKLEPRRADVTAATDRRFSTARQMGIPQETFTSTFKPSEKRFFTGVEVALAAVIASCGTARIRQNFSAVTTDERQGIANKQESSGQQNEDRESSEQQPDEQESNEQQKRSSVQQASKQESKQEARKHRDSEDKDFCDDDVPGSLRYLQTHKYSRRTIMIGPGDTFVSIAESRLVNRDGNLGWLIADINLPRIKETYIDGKRIVEVRSRQTIELPAFEDITAFSKHRKEEQKAENLVTIVVETQIDRELLNQHLGVFVDAGGKSRGPAVPGTAASSMFSRTAIGADGSGILPSLALESGNILKVGIERLKESSRAALDKGRKPFSRMRELLRRDKIKRRL
ncbi:MAG: hypothetical protein IT342_17025 [Candidatus Melainabacteria bacterium]|nr:hypothetical protein [Candidatus Melainabacteria bacterium]